MDDMLISRFDIWADSILYIVFLIPQVWWFNITIIVILGFNTRSYEKVESTTTDATT